MMHITTAAVLTLIAITPAGGLLSGAVTLTLVHPTCVECDRLYHYNHLAIESPDDPRMPSLGVTVRPDEERGHMLYRAGGPGVPVDRVAVQVAGNGRAVVSAWLPDRISLMDFETCQTGYGPCVGPIQ